MTRMCSRTLMVFCRMGCTRVNSSKCSCTCSASRSQYTRLSSLDGRPGEKELTGQKVVHQCDDGRPHVAPQVNSTRNPANGHVSMVVYHNIAGASYQQQLVATVQSLSATADSYAWISS